MKIAIIINTSWNIFNFRRGLVQQFLKRGDEVLAVAPHDAYSAKLKEIGCTFYHLPMKASGMNPLVDSVLLYKLYKLLKWQKPQVILTYTIKPNIYGSLVSVLLGVPCICNVSGLGTVFLWKGYVKKMASLLYSFAFRFNSWVFFQNDEDREAFLDLVIMDRRKTSLLPGSGIDITHFSPMEEPNNTVPVFLMISRLLIEKGIYDFIDAIKLIKSKSIPASFRLIGRLDPEHHRAVKKNELESWIADGLIEYIPHAEDIRPHIAAADVVVLPSYREGTPRTLLEAGAMGKAMIATNVAGCKHVVTDGFNGFLCKIKAPKDLASKIRLYLSLSEEEKKQLSLNARKSIVKRFDQQRVIDQYTDKIDELVNAKLK